MSTQPPPGGSRAAVSPAAGDRPLGQLLADMTSEMGTLVRQEIELAKVETKEEVTRAAKAAGALGAAAIAAHMGLLFLSLALAWLLDQAMNRALAFAIVGVVYVIGAAVLLAAGRRQAKLINPVPQQTVDTLKEDVAWAKARKN
jgi:uncharacterized membrane protein YqjE